MEVSCKLTLLKKISFSFILMIVISPCYLWIHNYFIETVIILYVFCFTCLSKLQLVLSNKQIICKHIEMFDAKILYKETTFDELSIVHKELKGAGDGEYYKNINLPIFYSKGEKLFTFFEEFLFGYTNIAKLFNELIDISKLNNELE